MKRIFSDYVYGNGPRADCYWDTTQSLPEFSALDADLSCDVAIIGAGFTGLNAALTLARRGVDVVVLEAEQPGWGASGRNGGFCCLGGSKLSDAKIDKIYGRKARLEWRQTEVAAVRYVDAFLSENSVDADRHSVGETWLAHRARDMDSIVQDSKAVEENYGVAAEVFAKNDLETAGMRAGFFGGLTIPIGFGLNPRKYLAGLLRSLRAANVRIFGASAVLSLKQRGRLWQALSKRGCVIAEQVLVATNGYSSESVPSWLSARYLPTQSSVLVTRPLSTGELSAQGWTTRQMCYDSRHLLHYFRLMPDNRMLFGMRGGLGGNAASDKKAKARVLRDFRHMFPAWSDVEVTHSWSGMVCLARNLAPFVGPIPGQPGLHAAMCYHGNGVAMGSYAGHLAGQLMTDAHETQTPALLRQPLAKFPLGSARRALLWPAYAAYGLADL